MDMDWSVAAAAASVTIDIGTGSCAPLAGPLRAAPRLFWPLTASTACVRNKSTASVEHHAVVFDVVFIITEQEGLVLLLCRLFSRSIVCLQGFDDAVGLMTPGGQSEERWHAALRQLLLLLLLLLPCLMLQHGGGLLEPRQQIGEMSVSLDSIEPSCSMLFRSITFSICRLCTAAKRVYTLKLNDEKRNKNSTQKNLAYGISTPSSAS